jgi:hypothetical protein
MQNTGRTQAERRQNAGRTQAERRQNTGKLHADAGSTRAGKIRYGCTSCAASIRHLEHRPTLSANDIISLLVASLSTARLGLVPSACTSTRAIARHGCNSATSTMPQAPGAPWILLALLPNDGSIRHRRMRHRRIRHLTRTHRQEGKPLPLFLPPPGPLMFRRGANSVRGDPCLLSGVPSSQLRRLRHRSLFCPRQPSGGSAQRGARARCCCVGVRADRGRHGLQRGRQLQRTREPLEPGLGRWGRR